MGSTDPQNLQLLHDYMVLACAQPSLLAADEERTISRAGIERTLGIWPPPDTAWESTRYTPLPPEYFWIIHSQVGQRIAWP
jgi:hypothetical protein